MIYRLLCQLQLKFWVAAGSTLLRLSPFSSMRDSDPIWDSHRNDQKVLAAKWWKYLFTYLYKEDNKVLHIYIHLEFSSPCHGILKFLYWNGKFPRLKTFLGSEIIYFVYIDNCMIFCLYKLQKPDGIDRYSHTTPPYFSEN